MLWQNTSTNPASLWLSKNFCTLSIIQCTRSHMISRIWSISRENSSFFAQPPLGLMHEVTFAEWVECIDSASNTTCHGMVILARILSSLLKTKIGMEGMLITRLRLLFSFVSADHGEVIPCALISWFVPAQDERDPDAGMWAVKPESTRACRPIQVIAFRRIARGAHQGLISFPNMVAGSSQLPFRA